MKIRYPWFAMTALALGLCMNANAYEKAAEAMKAAQQKLQAKDLVGAASDAAAALALAGANNVERCNALLVQAQVAEAAKDPAKAREIYTQVAGDAQAPTPQRVTAITRAANLLLNDGKFDEAKAEYARIPVLPGATPADKMDAALALGKAYERHKDNAKAAETYAAVAAEPTASKGHKTQAVRAIAKLHMDNGRFDDARAAYATLLAFPDVSSQDRADVACDVARSHERQGDYAKARGAYEQAAACPGLDAKSQTRILAARARTFQREGDLAGMKQAIAATAELTEVWLLRDYALLAAQKGNAAEEQAAWTQIQALPGINPTQYAEALFKRLDLLAADKQLTEAAKLAAEAAASAKCTDEQKTLAALLAAGFAMPVGGALDAKVMPQTALTADQQVKLFNEAAKLFMRARQYETARAFGNLAAARFPPLPANVYDCGFMDQAPFGVSGWQNSELVKDPARRETRFQEYNKKAAALLINDVNVVREVAAGEAKKSNAAFYMAADPRGWHIYVHCQDNQVEQVLAGLTGGGSLELYFAPGKGECYYQWMLSLPSAKASCVPWMSPHRYYRKLDDYLKTEVAPVADGFGVYMCIPWELVYDKLPRDGELWTFGLVNWSRDGGFTWGSGQVHELNRFGKIRFSGVEKYLPAIRRALVMKAYASYKKKATEATTFWKDEIKGDRTFFEQVLKPQLAQFDELGKLVKPDMTPAEVDKLFATTVPDWMEFGYKVAELRTAYLDARLTSEDN